MGRNLSSVSTEDRNGFGQCHTIPVCLENHLGLQIPVLLTIELSVLENYFAWPCVCFCWGKKHFFPSN